MVACEIQVVPWEVYGKIRSTDLGENCVTLVTIHQVECCLLLYMNRFLKVQVPLTKKLKTRSETSKKTLPAGLVKYDQIQIWWWKIRKSSPYYPTYHNDLLLIFLFLAPSRYFLSSCLSHQNLCQDKVLPYPC